MHTYYIVSVWEAYKHIQNTLADKHLINIKDIDESKSKKD